MTRAAAGVAALLPALALSAGRSAGAAAPASAHLTPASRPVEVLAFQRSGSNLLRTIHGLTYATSAYDARAHPGTAAHRYCLACVNCTIPGVGGIVRNAPGQTHFRLDKPLFRPKPPYTACGFPTLPLSVHALPDLSGLYGAAVTFLVVVKEPLFWLVSILKFWHLKCPDVTQEPCAHLLRDWTDYYGRWLELTGGRARVEAGGSAVEIVRYEDVLRDAGGLLDRLGRTYGWARQPNRSGFDLASLEVPHSGSDGFYQKRRESEHRTFLARPRHPDFPGDPLAWYRLNCPALRAFFARTDVPQRLGYDLWYLRECDPPGVSKRWRALLNARPWLLALGAAAALVGASWVAARRRAAAALAGEYAPLPSATGASPGSRR